LNPVAAATTAATTTTITTIPESVIHGLVPAFTLDGATTSPINKRQWWHILTFLWEIVRIVHRSSFHRSSTVDGSTTFIVPNFLLWEIVRIVHSKSCTICLCPAIWS
jgi:hypothetical protein